MSKRARVLWISLAGIVLPAILILQIPAVKSGVDWRVEKFTLYVKNVINPPGPVPTALPVASRSHQDPAGDACIGHCNADAFSHIDFRCIA
jgi:hypothetical protein